MTALVVTLAVFLSIGGATAVLLRLQQPDLGMCFILGAGANGALLYLLGAVGVPLTPAIFLTMPIASLIVLLWKRPRFGGAAGFSWPDVFFAIPVISLVAAASILPIRDYDGRTTWLPKARAIAIEESIDGPFFHSRSGLNLHNQYPLLIPLNAATVMKLTGDESDDVTRWLYVLVVVGALVAARGLLATLFGATGKWIIGAAAWLPALSALEGGALAAYSDLAVAAFAGLAVLLLMRDEPYSGAAMLAFLVLTKNEGLVMAMVIVAAVVVTRRRGWLPCVIAVIAAAALFVFWRTQIPAAYDHDYTGNYLQLPQSLHRVPHAVRALTRHAGDVAEWGWFWPATALAAFAVRRRTALPLVVIVLMFAVYIATFAVTTWDIDVLADGSARRLLSQLVLPACCVLAGAIRAVRSDDSVRVHLAEKSEL